MAVPREAFANRLKEAMNVRDQRTVGAVQLIPAALKERDVAGRSGRNTEGICGPEIADMLQAMIKQGRESIAVVEDGRPPDLVPRESDEIILVESPLPCWMSPDKIAATAKAAITETGAARTREMGKVMAARRERQAGIIDLGAAVDLGPA